MKNYECMILSIWAGNSIIQRTLLSHPTAVPWVLVFHVHYANVSKWDWWWSSWDACSHPGGEESWHSKVKDYWSRQNDQNNDELQLGKKSLPKWHFYLCKKHSIRLIDVYYDLRINLSHITWKYIPGKIYFAPMIYAEKKSRNVGILIVQPWLIHTS